MEFFPRGRGRNIHIKYNVCIIIFFLFIYFFRAWADTAFVDALLHTFCFLFFFDCISWGIGPYLYVSCAYLNESMDPHWRPKLLGLLQNWRRMIMQPHTRVLDQIITSSKGDLREWESPRLGPRPQDAKLPSENVGCKFRSKPFLKLSLPLCLFCTFPHTRPRPDGVTGIQCTYEHELAKGKTLKENP